ncbi:MAG: ferritin-like protein [Flaviaesturariibacter sp.]|nr:ferritin-like protein [Flaviaesturariibacter sp.]
MDPQSTVVQNRQESSLLEAKMHRRRFLLFSGTAATAALALASCDDKDDPTPTPSNAVNLGSGDVGILNYAYALEQLEAAFYTQVVAHAAFTTTFNPLEQEYLKDIRDHEVAHREFFKTAITAAAPTAIIPALTVDFSSINFGSRTSVLETARTFEDLGVAAYNGAGKLLTNPVYLTLAGKIVSVEARHAALIRDLISNGTFSDLGTLTAFGASTANALDGALNPPQVLQLADAFIVNTINASNLPTS